MDSRINDEDEEVQTSLAAMPDDDEEAAGSTDEVDQVGGVRDAAGFRRRAAEIYADYASRQQRRFRWLRPTLFVTQSLVDDLQRDADALLSILEIAGEWNPDQDEKLTALHKLLAETYPTEKVLVFTQFADTVRYLARELKRKGLDRTAGVTGDSDNPTTLAWRFSPVSNNKRSDVQGKDELRVLIATDVLSEGQNLQDSAIVVNYDLPWAIIRLVQRAGRVDRIGQRAERILVLSFLPAEGVERILQLRARVRRRLQENAEVVGTDEAFFEDDARDQTILDLYNENANVLDAEADGEVDLASYAFQIWKNATDANPELQKTIPELAPVSYSSKPFAIREEQPTGVLVYLRTSDDNDALAWLDESGQSVTQSQLEILKAAECEPDTQAVARLDQHHELVGQAVEMLVDEAQSVGGQLGRPSGARFRTYERLKQYAIEIQGTVFDTGDVAAAIDEIYRFPLRPTALDTLNRQLRSGISNAQLAELVIALREEGRLVLMEEERDEQEPQIICSLGLVREADR
jgi:hypothetical protein